MKLKSRYDLYKVLRESYDATGVEVGVANGDFSFAILSKWPGVMWMVDPWAAIDPATHQENIPADEQDRRYAGVIGKASWGMWKGRAKPLRLQSVEAAAGFDDGSLDFLYLDGDHSFVGVARDLVAWWPKMRPGAIIAGHDYLEGVIDGVSYGVKPAVKCFAPLADCKINTIDEEWPSWWAIVP